MQKIPPIASLVTMLVLVCCAFKPDPTDPGPPPSDYRQILKSYIRNNTFDPYSIRDAAVGDPAPGHLSANYGWLVCLQANVRNPMEGYMGGYMGVRKTVYLMKNDAVIQHVDDSQFCDTQKLVPWPELEK